MSPPKTTPSTGRLVLVATPIGDLDDLPPRARRAFAEADLVACEDTRRTGRLLAEIGVKRPLVSLHEHNERRRLPRLLALLDEGKTVAVASDAGTPLISDPGFVLAREAAARGAVVTAVPGPSAALVALVVSGLPPLPFTFGGFPPPKRGKRRTFYRKLGNLGHTLVLFESPHRLLASLDDALEELGDRPAAVARELTKTYEEVLRGSLAELHAALAERPALKGEFVVVIAAEPRGGDRDATRNAEASS